MPPCLMAPAILEGQKCSKAPISACRYSFCWSSDRRLTNQKDVRQAGQWGCCLDQVQMFKVPFLFHCVPVRNVWDAKPAQTRSPSLPSLVCFAVSRWCKRARGKHGNGLVDFT